MTRHRLQTAKLIAVALATSATLATLCFPLFAKPSDKVKNVRLTPTEKAKREQRDQALDKAHAAFRAKNLPMAEQHFRDALSVDPKNAFIWHNLGQVFRKQGKMREAVEAFAMIATDHDDWGSTFSTDPTFLVTYAELCEQTGKPEVAQETYNRIVENSKSEKRKGFIVFIDGTLKSPRENKAHAYQLAGLKHRSHGDFQEALACAEKAVRLAPGEPLSHILKGLACDEVGRKADALAALEKGASLIPPEMGRSQYVDDHIETLRYVIQERKRLGKPLNNPPRQKPSTLEGRFSGLPRVTLIATFAPDASEEPPHRCPKPPEKQARERGSAFQTARREYPAGGSSPVAESRSTSPGSCSPSGPCP